MKTQPPTYLSLEDLVVPQQGYNSEGVTDLVLVHGDYVISLLDSDVEARGGRVTDTDVDVAANVSVFNQYGLALCLWWKGQLGENIVIPARMLH